jgi:spore coat protein U-like protein
MKTNRTVLRAIAAAVLTATAGLAGAQTATQDLAVSATVQGICKFGSAPGWGSAAIPLTFAGIDPSGTADVTKSVDVPYRCTNGLTAAVAPTSANGWKLKNGTDQMTYSLDALAPVVSNGFSAVELLSVTGRITPANFQNAKALTYTDTVTLTLTF